MTRQGANNAEQQQPGATQPPLFDVTSVGAYTARVGGVNALTPSSPLPVARYWYRRHLEQSQHPKNTIESYLYDLGKLERAIGLKNIDAISARDIAKYLGESNTRSTRKRRLTSVNGFFKWLVHGAHMLDEDPTASFYPDHIPLKTPRPLLGSEQRSILVAAQNDSSRAAAMVWLMLRLGLSRGEVVGLRPEHVDLGDPHHPVIYVFYDNPRWGGKERKLEAHEEFSALFAACVAEYEPGERLFELLPQSVNKLVERVARAAGITRQISPQTLRDTWAVEQARAGASEEQLLAMLGLAEDSRNRLSVRRYLRLAAPPVNATSAGVD